MGHVVYLALLADGMDCGALRRAGQIISPSQNRRDLDVGLALWSLLPLEAMHVRDNLDPPHPRVNSSGAGYQDRESKPIGLTAH